MIQKLNNNDTITISLFGEETEVNVFSTDLQYEFGDPNGALSKEAIDCLNWLIENVDLADYKKEILAWCNEQYEMVGEEPITEEDLEEEIFISDIVINITNIPQSEDGTLVYPEISFFGDCECEPEHGICIGFRDKKFLGVDFQNWTIF